MGDKLTCKFKYKKKKRKEKKTMLKASKELRQIKKNSPHFEFAEPGKILNLSRYSWANKRISAYNVQSFL